jgi:hypothetical protein
MGIDASLAGRSIKCPCGNICKAVGGAPVSPSQSPSKPPSTAPAKSLASKQPASAVLQPAAPAQSSTAKKKVPVPARQQPSFLDQLTEADLTRPATNPYDPPPSNHVSEAVVLRKYAGTDGIEEEVNKTANGNIKFLAVLNFIGATVYLGLGVLILVLSSVMGTIANVLPLAALGAIFAAILFGFGFFDLVSGIGLIKRTFWGWWICIVGLGWSIFDRGSSIAIRFMFTQDWTAEIPKAIGTVLFMLSSFYFLHFMCQKKTMKMFKVNVHAGVAWSIAIVLGLLLGGAGFGVALSAVRSVQAAP